MTGQISMQPYVVIDPQGNLWRVLAGQEEPAYGLSWLIAPYDGGKRLFIHTEKFKQFLFVPEIIANKLADLSAPNRFDWYEHHKTKGVKLD